MLAASAPAFLLSCQADAPPGGATPRRTGRPHVFYRPRDVGSESLFDPVSSFVSYTLDSRQVSSFREDEVAEGLEIVGDHLAHPFAAVQELGGPLRFVNTEIYPVDPRNLYESKAILPNYALHLFGGGMLYRKNAEWLDAHGYPAPFVTSGVLAMISEVLQEAIEKPTTDPTDEVADVFLFRPFGIWLFSDDERARRIQESLHPVDWPYLTMYDAEQEEIVNVGVSYVVRPDWGPSPATRPFLHLGLTNLLGLAHEIPSGDTVSWGLGFSTVSVKPTRIHASAGVFYDRDDSLLASLVVNGTEELDLRANVYPGAVLSYRYPLGLFVGLGEEGDVTVGLHFGLPVGLAR